MLRRKNKLASEKSENAGYQDVEIGEMSGDQDKVLSIKQIGLVHIKKIADLVTQELTPGFWEKKPMQVSSGVIMIEKYHPDLRIAYCNAMDFLIDLVYPYCTDKDGDFKEFADKHIYTEEMEFILNIDNINVRMMRRRLAFRKMNIMFEKTNYFESGESYSE